MKAHSHADNPYAENKLLFVTAPHPFYFSRSRILVYTLRLITRLRFLAATGGMYIAIVLPLIILTPFYYAFSVNNLPPLKLYAVLLERYDRFRTLTLRPSIYAARRADQTEPALPLFRYGVEQPDCVKSSEGLRETPLPFLSASDLRVNKLLVLSASRPTFIRLRCQRND